MRPGSLLAGAQRKRRPGENPDSGPAACIPATLVIAGAPCGGGRASQQTSTQEAAACHSA